MGRGYVLCLFALIMDVTTSLAAGSGAVPLQVLGDRPCIVVGWVQEPPANGLNTRFYVEALLKGDCSWAEVGGSYLRFGNGLNFELTGEVQDLATEETHPVTWLTKGQRCLLAFQTGRYCEATNVQAARLAADGLVRLRVNNKEVAVPLADLKTALWDRQIGIICNYAQSGISTEAGSIPSTSGVVPERAPLWLAFTALVQPEAVERLTEAGVKRLMGALLMLLDDTTVVANFSPSDGPVIALNHLAAELYGFLSYRYFGPGVPWQGGQMILLPEERKKRQESWQQQRQAMEHWWATHRNQPREGWREEGLALGRQAVTDRKLPLSERYQRLTVFALIDAPQVGGMLRKLADDETENPVVREHARRLLKCLQDRPRSN